MENYQAQPYDLRNFVNMVQIEEYHEGSVHTVHEGGSSSPSSTASNGSIHTELQLRNDEEVDYDLDILDRPRGFHDSHPSHQGEET